MGADLSGKCAHPLIIGQNREPLPIHNWKNTSPPHHPVLLSAPRTHVTGRI